MMNCIKRLACISTFALLCYTGQAAGFSDTTHLAKHAATEDEKQTIAGAINKYLDITGIQIGDLDVSSTGDGGKLASGKVSFFGMDNIELKAEITTDRKVKSITSIFPASATVTPDKLLKFLSGKSLSSFLPKSFPLQTGISIKELSLAFDDKGDSLDKVSLNFGTGNYAIDGFNGFAIDGMEIGFTLDKPTSPQRKASATVSGEGKIGAIPVNLSATMSSDPDDLLFSFTATGINITSLLSSFLSDSKTNKLLRFIPASVKSAAISSITASFNPTNKNFSALAQTSIGDAELQFNGASAESKSAMLFALAPPADFRFSSLSGTLAPLDGIGLTGTALIISTLAEEDATCHLPALQDEGDIRVEEGVNVFSTIRLNADIAKLLKVNQVKLRGTCNETFTNMSMSAALDLNIPMGQNITMKEVVFGTRLGTVNPVEFNIGGKIEAKIGEDLVGFNASFAFAPIDQKISGEFFMEALQKKNNPLVKGKLGPDGKSDLPEWTNPFGIPGVGLRKLGVGAGIDFKNPILLSSLGFTGAARLGTVQDRAKHIEGDATVVIDITKPTNSLIDITMKNMTILAMIEAFVDNANIQGQLRTMLNSGIDQGRVLVVPIDGMQAFGKTYNKGVSVSGQLSLGGIKANGDFSLNESGVSGAGSMDAVNWGNGAFVISGRTTDKPQFRFAYAKGSLPSFFIDGKISLLGISSETTASLDAAGFSFTTSGKIANSFEATLEGKGSFNESAKGIYVRASLRNDLVSQLNQLVTGKINEAIQTTKNTFQESRNKLAKAKADIIYIDEEIRKRTAALLGEKRAAAQKVRDEAIRAMNEQQQLINTCLANNRSSQEKINALPDWRFLEKGAYYTAIASNNATIEAAKVAYAGYLGTVNTTADIVEDFPNDFLLTDLLAKKVIYQATLSVAELGLDAAEGISVTTLEATKWVMDKTLGGLFDIKTAEFAGTFGLTNQYKVNAAINFTLGNNPYNMVAELDFSDLLTSAGKIAKDILGGTLIKPGFAPTFGSQLNKPVSNITLVSAPKILGADANTVAAVKPVTTAPAMNIPVSATATTGWAGKFFRIENLWKAGQRINNENGSLTSSNMFDAAWSAQWSIKPVPGTNYYWIENHWKGTRLNVEKGYLDCSVISNDAWSGHWELKKIGPNLYWLENRWKTGERINVESGKLSCNTIRDGANSAMWYIREVKESDYDLNEKLVRLDNVWMTGSRINIENGPLVFSPASDGAFSAQWILKKVPGTTFFWIVNKWKPEQRIHIENGPIAAGSIHDGALSAQWSLKSVPGSNAYWIENRWKPGQRINVEKGSLQCSMINDNAQSAQWILRYVY
ncbi:MAG: hypothetical protein IPP73_16720 [Chitinophagaceae bacterium]|nr:hypothetical protein [Chitinophagaceae bacterium]